MYLHALTQKLKAYKYLRTNRYSKNKIKAIRKGQVTEVMYLITIKICNQLLKIMIKVIKKKEPMSWMMRTMILL